MHVRKRKNRERKHTYAIVSDKREQEDASRGKNGCEEEQTGPAWIRVGSAGGECKSSQGKKSARRGDVSERGRATANTTARDARN